MDIGTSEILTQFGVAGLFFVMVMLMWKWMSAQVSKMFDRFDKERENATSERNKERDNTAIERDKWFTVLNGFQKCVVDIDSRLQEFSKQVSQAHTFQREEHVDILNNLNRANEAHNNRESEHDKIVNILDQLLSNSKEQHQVLLRINGEKH